MAKFNVGDRVEVYYNRKWHSGVVVSHMNDFSWGDAYLVETEDGDHFKAHEGRQNIRPKQGAKSLRAKYKAVPSGTRFVVLWNTGDRDTCYGRRDLMDLLDETGCTVEHGKVIDEETLEKVGTVQEVS